MKNLTLEDEAFKILTKKPFCKAVHHANILRHLFAATFMFAILTPSVVTRVNIGVVPRDERCPLFHSTSQDLSVRVCILLKPHCEKCEKRAGTAFTVLDARWSSPSAATSCSIHFKSSAFSARVNTCGRLFDLDESGVGSSSTFV